MAKAKPVPDGHHTVTPYLAIRDAAKAIEFYKNAFGAEELFRMPGPDGKIMHAEILIGDSPVMISEEFPEYGTKSPQALGGTAVNIFLYVENVDKVFDQAVKAGATVTMPVADQFWGDRYGKLADPFGHEWSVATHVEDVAPDEMAKRAAKAMGA
jgi:PhnB protein